MTPAMIAVILQSLLQAAPMILELFQKATAGGTVTQADIADVLQTYGIDRAVFLAAIAKAEAARPPAPVSSAAPPQPAHAAPVS